MYSNGAGQTVGPLRTYDMRGLGSFWDDLLHFIQPSLTQAEREARTAAGGAVEDLLRTVEGTPIGAEALRIAREQATQDMIRRYGPLVLGGLVLWLVLRR